MELSYLKNDNTDLFFTLGTFDDLHFDEIQNYIPIYNKFFALNENNYNSINLNHKFSIKKIISCETQNKCDAIIFDNDGKLYEKKVFFKLSPLLDPIKYLVGKYDISDTCLFNLPKYTETVVNEKINDPNNSAYVDSFATYLTSQLLHKHGFIHGLDFYGSFLAIKNNFYINLNEDIEYLYDSTFFQKHQGILYTIDNLYHEEFMNYNSRNMKKRITVDKDTISPSILKLSDISDLSELDDILENETSQTINPLQCISVESVNNNKSAKSVVKDYSSSSCSSRSSNTINDNSDSASESESEQTSECSTATEDAISATIPKFPVQAIALERCENTFDYLLSQNSLSDRELSSAIIQILMILITLQKSFSLTHNDLHTNNIMWIQTDKKFLFYKINKIYYKVPTFGKIYKLIDFGRAIYKFKGKQICSDSFHPKGDAATQYNIEPYMNDKKPRLDANFSFDLCRLGCSIYDFIVEDISNEMKDLSEIEKIIVKWCHDDKDRNVMYKINGQERYPEFKLYKMIARTCHKHMPLNVLNDIHFSKYIVNKKQAHKNNRGNIMDIDSYPIYTD